MQLPRILDNTILLEEVLSPGGDCAAGKPCFLPLDWLWAQERGKGLGTWGHVDKKGGFLPLGQRV